MRPPPEIAVLVNPRSGRVRRRVARVRALAHRLAGERYAETSDPQAMAEFVARAAPGPDGVLCVAGGDGSVQAVLTALERQRPQAAWPLLAAAPGGTTNMTARDLGEPVKLTTYLRRLARWAESGGSGGSGSDADAGAGGPSSGGRLVSRPVLRIAPPLGDPVAGMFLGAGAVAAGVDMFHRSFKPRGIPEGVAFPLIIGRYLAALASPGRRRDELAPRVTLSVDGTVLQDRRALFLFTTTLHRLLLGTHPYWGAEEGPMHTTLVEGHVHWGVADVPRFARGAGPPRFTPELGWHSHNAHRVGLAFDGPWIVDGEVLHARASDGPLEITAGRTVRWWVP